MNFKKIMSLGLAVTMTVMMLSGCGNDTGKVSSESKTSEASQSSEISSQSTSVEEEEELTFPLKETMEFDIVGLRANDKAPLAENASLLYLQEQANFKFNWTEIPGAEFEEKINLMLASGTYPEVLYKSDIDDDKYGAQGILHPLEDIIKEYMPNLVAVLDEYDVWDDVAASDGHIYALPFINSMQYFADGLQDQVAWINAEWLKTVGKENPTSMEELYDVLKAFKEQDPNGNGDADEIPLLFRGAGSWQGIKCLYQFLGDGRFYAGKNIAIMKEDVVNGIDKLTYYPTTEAYYDFLKWMAKFYEEGLIYKDAFTASQAQVEAITKAADVTGLCVKNNLGYFVEPWKYNYEIMNFFDEDMVTRSVSATPGGLLFTDVMDIEKVKVFCAFWDYMYTEEGGMLLGAGVKGVHWDWTDGSMTEWDYLESGQSNYVLQGGAGVAAYKPAMFVTKRAVSTEDAKANLKNMLPFITGEEFTKKGVLLPNLTFTVEEEERLSELTANLNGIVNNYLAEVIIGARDLESTWDEFQKSLKDMGVEELMTIYQASYDRAK